MKLTREQKEAINALIISLKRDVKTIENISVDELINTMKTYCEDGELPIDDYRETETRKDEEPHSKKEKQNDLRKKKIIEPKGKNKNQEPLKEDYIDQESDEEKTINQRIDQDNIISDDEKNTNNSPTIKKNNTHIDSIQEKEQIQINSKINKKRKNASVDESKNKQIKVLENEKEENIEIDKSQEKETERDEEDYQQKEETEETEEPEEPEKQKEQEKEQEEKKENNSIKPRRKRGTPICTSCNHYLTKWNHKRFTVCISNVECMLAHEMAEKEHNGKSLKNNKKNKKNKKDVSIDTDETEFTNDNSIED